MRKTATFHDTLFKSSSHTFLLKVLGEGVNFRSKGSEFDFEQMTSKWRQK